MHRNVKEVLENDPDAYYNNEELLEPLKLMYRSLMATNDDGIANGRLLDVLRQARPALGIYSLLITLATSRASLGFDWVCSSLQKIGILLCGLLLLVLLLVPAAESVCVNFLVGKLLRGSSTWFSLADHRLWFAKVFEWPAGELLRAGHGGAGHPAGVHAAHRRTGRHHHPPGPGLLQVPPPLTHSAASPLR